jgi:hypothetical protein
MKRAVMMLVAILLLAHAQATSLHSINATELRLAGFLDGQGLLGGLTADDAADGQAGASTTIFALTAEALRIETDARPVVAVAGAHVPRDPEHRTTTYSGAELRAVQGHPGHQITVLPSGQANLRIQERTIALTPQDAGRMAVEHFVDEGRAPIGVDMPRSVQVDGLTEATIRIDGDIILSLWYWDFMVQEGSQVTTYSTGYVGEQVVGAPVMGDVAGHGHRIQAYVYATNATLTMVPEIKTLDLRILRPAFQGVTTAAALAATGQLEATTLLSDELELQGDAMDVTLDHVRAGLLQFDATGVKTFRVGDGPAEALAGAKMNAEAGLLPVLTAILAIAVLAAGTLLLLLSSRRRLALAGLLLRRGQGWPARLLLRLHLRLSPHCIEGLTMLIRAEETARRPAKELEVRLRAARVLVDADRIHNARRILHLYARLGRDDDALTWFEACKQDDPRLIQEMIYEPSFRSIDQRLRERAKHAVGWEDPTGA